MNDSIPAARETAASEPAFLSHPTLDRLVTVVLELGAQLWIERDRRQILEAILTARGALPVDAIETYRHSPEAQAARERDKEAFVERLFGSLKTL